MDIFENEGQFHNWRIANGAPISYSSSNIITDDRSHEKGNKENLLSEIITMFNDPEILPLLTNNSLYDQIDNIMDKLNGMISEELKNIKHRLNLLIKHKNPVQVTKLFRFILEY